VISRRQLGAGLLAGGLALGAACGTALAAPLHAASAGVPAGVHDAGDPAATPGPVPPVFTGDVQAVAVRIEADEPLPVGTGDIPSLAGQVNAQENFANATSAVDLLGAVIGPKVADPTGDGHQYTQLPQATCVYPSEPNTDAQSYPFDGTDQQTAQSEATCSAGPQATAQAYATQIGGNAGVTNPNELETLGLSAVPLGVNGAVTGHELLGPDTTLGAAKVAADAEVHNFSITGLFTVAGVEASGWSQASGRPGGAATNAQVDISDLSIAGTSISIGPNGIQLGTGPTVPVSQAGPLVDEFNQSASSVGCNLTVLSNPADYPQGTLFARPPLPNRVKADGSDAGSTAAGAALRCVVPDNLNPTTVKPLILQVLLGFVGTEANASSEPLQYGIGTGDLGIGSGLQPGSVAPAAAPPAAPDFASGAPALATPAQPFTPSRAAASPSPPRLVTTVGALLPARTTLEMAGLILAALAALFGLNLVAPWRVTLAPVDHPEA